jgi:putative NADH-flavin reductase
MKVVLYGASGTIGRRILDELLSRGHQVTAVVRDPAKLGDTKATVATGDALSSSSVAETATGAEVAISAYGPPPTDTGLMVEATRALIAGLGDAGVKRFLMVGGAGSLEVAPGVELVDAPIFPAEWKPIALAHRNALEVLKMSNLEWTSLSPAAFIAPGERTGKFRLGLDQLITDPANGQSHISAEDFAVALVDELEVPKHVRKRFTVGY